jgi:uncharacterized protein VirK/YbjX
MLPPIQPSNREKLSRAAEKLDRYRRDRPMSVTIQHDLTGNGRPSAPANSILLGPLKALLDRKETWSPSLLVEVVWRVASNVGTHLRVRRFIQSSALSGAVAGNPRFPFKCLFPSYLVRGLSVAEGVACFLHHYQRLLTALRGRFLRQVMQGEVVLDEIRRGGNDFAITMGLSRPYDKEGELSLNLQVNGETVFVLSFTIVPGWVVRSEAEEVLLITRIQGMKGAYRQISLATKALHDVAPESLLLAALHGVASAFGIRTMASICATMQSSYNKLYASSFTKGYDGFFADLGIAQNDAGFFLSAIPAPEKPIELIKQGHKLRTREKRAFKRHVAAEVRQALREEMVRPQPVLE